MRTILLLCLLASPLVLLTGPAARAQGTVELKYAEINGPDHSLFVGSWSAGYALKGDHPVSKGFPEGLSNNAYFFRLMVAEGWLAAVLDQGGRSPRLYVDTDADGVLSDETPIDVRILRGRLAYTVAWVQVPGRPEGTNVRIGLDGDMDLYSSVHLRIGPAGYVWGIVGLSGV